MFTSSKPFRSDQTNLGIQHLDSIRRGALFFGFLAGLLAALGVAGTAQGLQPAAAARITVGIPVIVSKAPVGRLHVAAQDGRTLIR